ncbi:MAG: histidine--tRNA ligase [Anaerolineales bacterium]|nr:MAG: histidine--tRNA ligase [Anaerolineales bacterium]
MPIIQPVRGTRDFYPEDMAFRQWLNNQIREASAQFGYQEFDGPFLERLELYAAKSGDELVKEQSYVFPDRSGSMIALRPELTPSLARMVAQRGKGLTLPLRWWSFGPFWRYERKQKGRSREFFQWNIDLIGVDTPEADAELVAVAATLFRNVGLTADMIRIKVNNRRLAEKQLQEIGIQGELLPITFRLIDRQDRMTPDAWKAYALESGLKEDQFKGLVKVLEDLEAWKSSPEMLQYFKAVEALGAGEYLDYDPTVIRGLDYYTGTVYEARDVKGNHRSILGGGRYDDLVSVVGGDLIPATGFAMGDVVFGLVLDENGIAPDLRVCPADILITTFEESSKSISIQIATELREAGYRVEWYPEPVRLQRQLKYADRNEIPLVVIIGPDEMESDKVSLKDMVSGEQKTFSRSDLLSRIKNQLSG